MFVSKLLSKARHPHWTADVIQQVSVGAGLLHITWKGTLILKLSPVRLYNSDIVCADTTWSVQSIHVHIHMHVAVRLHR